MNNNINMAGMGPMGGPVGGGIPMMNNGLPGGVPRGAMPPVNDNQQKSQLNTYIYEYFLRNEMWDAARAIINSDQPINVVKASPGSRRDGNGNMLDNGVSPDGDSKDDMDSKRPDDLPLPNLPRESPDSCFLYEWWCLFWDMFNAQRGKGDVRGIQLYVAHTQSQSKNRQEHQQHMLRNMRPDQMSQAQYNQMLLRNPKAAMGMNQNELARQAMVNNGRNVTPAQMQAFQQQQQLHQKQQQMARDGADMEGNRPRPQSPGSAENAPSPSKRPRLEGAPFNNGQPGMPNGRGQPQGLPQQQQVGPNGNAIQATQMLLANGVNNGLTPQQFQNLQAQQNQQQPGGPAGKAQSLQAYTSNLVQHQQSQMPNKGMPNPNGPQNQGSPMMTLGQDGNQIGQYYNASDLAGAGGGGGGPMRGGQPGQPGQSGNHALQDYQMQLMLLEQQNKKRLMMARQEQDSMVPREGGPGGPGANGQQFQGTSPQGPRSGSSPNPNDQMKRGTPQMNAAGIPSPLPDGQSRGSPGAMNFMAGQMDPSMPPQFYKQMNGMEGNMGGAMPNGMRPPSSHPQGFNGQQQLNAQMMMARQHQAAQQQQAQVAGGQVPGWQTGPNGAPMMQQGSQGQLPQAMGTPQQRAMPPPSAPAAGAPANGRTQPSSPQQNPAPPTPSQTNKANPKGKKDTKPKRNAKKGTTTTGATPSADTAPEPATPTPATPITPQHPKSFNVNGQNGAGPNMTNGQLSAPAPAPVVAAPQPDPNQGSFLDDNSMFGGMGSISMDFANPNMGGSDVLQDFDFDSFLHQDGGDADAFAFDTSGFGMEGGEVGAE